MLLLYFFHPTFLKHRACTKRSYHVDMYRTCISYNQMMRNLQERVVCHIDDATALTYRDC